MSVEIKKYLNAYQYLQDCYQLRKQKQPEFSYALWATEMGASDKSYVRMMVLGKRHINSKMTECFAQNIQLSKEEREFFINLVHYTQSKTQEQKKLFGKKLMSLLRSEKERVEIQAHYDFLSNPLLPRLQVLLSFDDIDHSAKTLSWLLGVTTEEIAEGLSKLCEIGLIKEENGRYKSARRSFNIPDNFGDLGLENFYIHNLEAAKEAIRLPKETRRFKSLFVPLNPTEFENFVANFQDFVRENLGKFDTDTYSDRRLYQVHFNIIPISSAQETEAELSEETI